MLPLGPIKDAFKKFEQDFWTANLPDGKYIKTPASTTKWYKVGQPCFEDKLQELYSDFAKTCISPKPSGTPLGKVPLQVVKEFDHQARQNLNFSTTFTRTAFECNTTMEKCQDSIKATVIRIKGANPEKAARHGYERTCYYLDNLNKRILIQHRALAWLSKALAHIL